MPVDELRNLMMLAESCGKKWGFVCALVRACVSQSACAWVYMRDANTIVFVGGVVAQGEVITNEDPMLSITKQLSDLVYSNHR